MKIVHCQNTSALAKNISDHLRYDISKISISKFPSEEINIQIHDVVEGHNILVVHELYPNIHENLIQLVLLISSLKQKGAKNIYALLPYLPYSRMDKDNDLESAAIRSIATLLEFAGLDKLTTFDLHSEACKNYFNIPVINITALEIFKPLLLNYKNQDCVIISPDLGGKTRCKQVADFLTKPLIVAEKERNSSCVTSIKISGNINNKHCIIIDDIISTGETILKTIELLKNRGAKSIDVIATHLLLSDTSTLSKIESHVSNGFIRTASQQLLISAFQYSHDILDTCS